MANAKRCDICGEYFIIPDLDNKVIDYGARAGAVHLYKLEDANAWRGEYREGSYFDACDKCVQDITDYILTRRATWEKGETK